MRPDTLSLVRSDSIPPSVHCPAPFHPSSPRVLSRTVLVPQYPIPPLASSFHSLVPQKTYHVSSNTYSAHRSIPNSAGRKPTGPFVSAYCRMSSLISLHLPKTPPLTPEGREEGEKYSESALAAGLAVPLA